VGGGNPIKAFWVDISETVNNTENEQLKVVNYAHDNGDEVIYNYVKRGIFQPADFNQTTYSSCSQTMKDVTRAHEQVKAAMTKVSGTHCTDMTKYLNPVHLTVRQNVVMPGAPVYYYAKLVEDHPGMEGSWNVMLSEELMSSSTTTPGETSDCKPNSNATASTSSLTTTTKSKEKVSERSDIILQAIKNTATLLEKKSEKDPAVSAASEQLYQAKAKLVTESQTRQQWKEYDEWGDRITKLESNLPRSERLLCNLAIRVRTLETQLGIPLDASIVRDYVDAEGST
jgi:hypothetical protein